jgi:hypothetical protein
MCWRVLAGHVGLSIAVRWAGAHGTTEGGLLPGRLPLKIYPRLTRMPKKFARCAWRGCCCAIPMGEADRLLLVYTASSGKLRALAKGCVSCARASGSPGPFTAWR